jgi:hypothetical protein
LRRIAKSSAGTTVLPVERNAHMALNLTGLGTDAQIRGVRLSGPPLRAPT